MLQFPDIARRRAKAGLHQTIAGIFDAGAMARGARETVVAGDEGRVERLGESDSDGVIRRQVGPQLPHARAKRTS
jgi:hypothetical protein